MKVSIILIANSNDKYLSDSLDSLVNQVYKNIEIIIIDNGSNENTKKIINDYVKKDNRIIPFYQDTKKTCSFAKNIGLKTSTGEYIIFINSNGKLTKEAIRRMVDVANKYNSDIVDSYKLLEYKSITFTKKRLPKKAINLKSINEHRKIVNLTNSIIGKLIRRDLFEDITFNEELNDYEDIVILSKLRTKAKNYTLLNRPIYISNEELNNEKDNYIEDYLEVVREVKKNYKNCDLKIRDTAEAMLMNDIVIILIKELMKSKNSITEDIEFSKNYIKQITKSFPKYKLNKSIKLSIRKNIEVYLNDEKKLQNFIIKVKKKNYVDKYYKHLSIVNKYVLKNPLE